MKKKSKARSRPPDDALAFAKDAIEAVFSDTSVTSETTTERLEELRDEIDTRLEALEEDRKRARDRGGR